LKKLKFKKYYTYGFAVNRIRRVIESCNTIIQLRLAEQYCSHLVQILVYGTTVDECYIDLLSSIDQYVQYKLLTGHIEELIEEQEKKIMREI